MTGTMVCKGEPMKNYSSLGFQIPQILVPKPDIDPQKWSVIACDQYTSQPDYWEKVSNFVGNNPSTFHIILPEIYLDTPREAEKFNLPKQPCIPIGRWFI